MSVDFRDAAKRHWEDAGFLSADSRLANADHLYGLSAECALKTVMLSLGMSLRADGAPEEKQHRVHVNNLWNEFVTFAHNRNGAHYAARLIDSNPFHDWHIEQRYENRSGITREATEKHRQAALTTWQILEIAILNGDIK